MFLSRLYKLLFYNIILLLCLQGKLGAESNLEELSLDKLIDNVWHEELLELYPKKKPNITKQHKASKEDNYKADDFSDLGVLMDSIETNLVHKTRIIVIDAGHGGKDPGAIGHKKLQEKNIVLAYAKALKSKLEKNQRYNVYLTRDKDVYLPLRKRIAIARKYKADMFISLHADAAHNKKASGLTVYTLSEKASNKEASLLAKKENKVDIVSGLDLSDLDKDVSDALIGLSFRDAKNKSILFAKLLNQNLRKRVQVRQNSHHSAGFVVLKNSNMASVLIELGFITNKTDSKNLQKKSYQDKFLKGASEAINKYFSL